jgi:enolase
MKVRKMEIRPILAFNAQKTIEIDIHTEKGMVRASVPIGTSKGKNEITYLPIDDVLNKFFLYRREFTKESFDSIREVDHDLKKLDGTNKFSSIGGNLALGISMAFLKAFALHEGKDVFEILLEKKPKMPTPLCNVAGGWEDVSDIQEYMLYPVHFEKFSDVMFKMAEIYRLIENVLAGRDKNFMHGRNLESGWVTGLKIDELLEILTNICKDNMLRIGLDIAGSGLFNGTFYVLKNEEKKFTIREYREFVLNMVKKYPIHYVEDPFEEDDFNSHAILQGKIRPRMVCGDDLYTTNLSRLIKGIKMESSDVILIKPNQIGTISDVIEVVKAAKKHEMKTVMSHRSGESEDNLISHLAVGLGCDFVKMGIAGERVVKLNELARIEEKIIN